MARSPRRRAALAVPPSAALALVAAALVGGCGGRFSVSEDAWTGPPVRLQAVGGRHVVVVESPSPGWSIRDDRTDAIEGATRVFLTIRRPDPQFVYTQQIVEQHVATSVPAEAPVEVVARLLDHDQKPRRTPYRRAAPEGKPSEQISTE